MTELVVRLVFSLAVVLGLLLLCARVAGKRWQGSRSAMVQVLHRQQISRNAAVSVVNVGGRVLVLGTTDQGIRLLTELDSATLTDADTTDADDQTDDLIDGFGEDEDLLVLEPTLTLLPGGPAAVLLAESDQEPALARPGRHAAARPPRTTRATRATRATRGTRSAPAAPATTQHAPLAGSVLSVTTWKQAWAAVTGRAS